MILIRLGCGINSKEENAPTTLPGTIDHTTNVSKITVYVIPKDGVEIGLNETVKVQVTASTSVPYQKTLSCEFTIKAATLGSNTYSIEDEVGRDYALLKLTCPGAASTVTISYDPKQLRVDSNDEVYVNCVAAQTVMENTYGDGKLYVKKFVYNMPGETTKYVKFYKVDKSENYTYPGVEAYSAIQVTI